MKLFTYYVCHTFVNQLKKLFKTWVFIFILVCFVMGIGIGLGTAKLSEAHEAQKTPEQIQQEQQKEEEAVPLPEKLGVSGEDLMELIVGGLTLGGLVFFCLMADRNGSKIFLPADVNLLFPSPMKPQSVLTFRLVTRMGAGVLASGYLLIEMPILAEGVGTWAMLSVVGALYLVLIGGNLLQTLLYTACSTRPGLKKYLSRGIYAFLLAVGAAYFIYWKSTDLTNVQAAAVFFNHPVTRFLPFWGWIKAFVLSAFAGNVGIHLLSLAAMAAGSFLLGYAIWHMKADFYEDAMAKSQETAAIMEATQSEKTVVRKRKKDRSDKLGRDGMTRGWGADIFFWKTLYNRFRFAHFHVFTKTSETYLVAALGISALCMFILDAPGVLPVCLSLGVLCFFRALGNPLQQDTDLDLFRMIPESTWAKVFWSLLGGTACCLMDLLPALGAAAIIWRDPLAVLAWLPVIVSVDFFSSAVIAFINLSVPVSAGKMVKQFAAVIFIYFGLLPDIALIAVGIIYHQVLAAALAAVVLNLALGLGFVSLLPLFIEPKEGKSPEPRPQYEGSLKPVRKKFSRMGVAVSAFLVLGSAVQLLGAWLLPGMAEHPLGKWLILFAPIYLVGFPVCVLLLRRVPAPPLEKRSMSLRRWVSFMLICEFFLGISNLIGTIIMAILGQLLPISNVNPVEMITMHQPVWIKLLVVVTLAPIVEETVFRKLLIDRMHPYGGKLAVVVTALLFGLFHGNILQFTYTFALGLILGYVYLSTGKVRYSVFMHMLINLKGGVLVPMLLEHLGQELLESSNPADLLTAAGQNPWALGFMLYMAAQYALILTGLVVMCVRRRKTEFRPEAMELPAGRRVKAVFWNPGMVLTVLLCLGAAVYALM